MPSDMTELTLRQKARALVAFGLADDINEAYAQLEDMGEDDD